MELKAYKIFVECGEYWGGGTDGAWTSSTDKQFYTTVTANCPQTAVQIAEQQFGGPTRCRVQWCGDA